MFHSTKSILLFLTSLILIHPYSATAADKNDLNEVIRLIRETATNKDKPSFYLSYMGLDYTTSVGLKDGKPEFVEIVTQTYYGTRDEFKTYTLKDDDLDGKVDSAVYQEGGVTKGTFDREKETGKDVRRNSQSLYDSAIHFTLRKLNKK